MAFLENVGSFEQGPYSASSANPSIRCSTGEPRRPHHWAMKPPLGLFRDRFAWDMLDNKMELFPRVHFHIKIVLDVNLESNALTATNTGVTQ